jgi:hypothetical protein
MINLTKKKVSSSFPMKMKRTPLTQPHYCQFPATSQIFIYSPSCTALRNGKNSFCCPVTQVICACRDLFRPVSLSLAPAMLQMICSIQTTCGGGVQDLPTTRLMFLSYEKIEKNLSLCNIFTTVRYKLCYLIKNVSNVVYLFVLTQSHISELLKRKV